MCLGKNFIDEEFGNNNAIFRRHEGTQMFKATVLNFIAVVGVLVQANIQRTKLLFPIRGRRREIAVQKQRFDACLDVFIISRSP